MIKQIVLNGSPVSYELEYKNVKRINLRVHKDGRVCVSASRFTGQKQIEAFLIQNSTFILRALEKFRSMREAGDGMAVGKNRQYADGDTLYLRGKPYRLRVIAQSRESVEEIGAVLLVGQKDIYDEARRKRMMEKFLTDRCREEIDVLCRNVYPAFERLGVCWPQIRIRSMVSRWGSCQPAKGVLTFARQLVEVPQTCMEYVVVHEFAHFIHPDHSPRFHAFMTEMMPNWKERRDMLNHRGWIAQKQE